MLDQALDSLGPFLGAEGGKHRLKVLEIAPDKFCVELGGSLLIDLQLQVVVAGLQRFPVRLAGLHGFLQLLHGERALGDSGNEIVNFGVQLADTRLGLGGFLFPRPHLAAQITVQFVNRSVQRGTVLTEIGQMLNDGLLHLVSVHVLNPADLVAVLHGAGASIIWDAIDRAVFVPLLRVMWRHQRPAITASQQAFQQEWPGVDRGHMRPFRSQGLNFVEHRFVNQRRVIALVLLLIKRQFADVNGVL